MKESKVRIEVDQTQFKELILWVMDIPDYENTLLWKVLNQKLNSLIDNELYSQYKNRGDK